MSQRPTLPDTFNESFPGEFETKVPGGFGFTVTVHTEDEDGDPADPRYGVRLPHQCDAWKIVQDEPSHAAALDLLRGFIREAQKAYDTLSRAVPQETTDQPEGAR